jgi:4-diphosphocytidyl-2-C-methyl-D-erythritol kinase
MIIKTPAKINFGLWIGEKRPDGYHSISTVFIPITLYDTITVKLTEKTCIHFKCNTSAVPHDSTNLCWRAAELFLNAKNFNTGISITLEKEIPVEAGLGGGSSDAAAVLMGLLHLFPGIISPAQLHQLAVRLGADVPFFLNPVPSSASGIGEELTPIKFLWKCPILLVIPPIKISTKTAYTELDRKRTKKTRQIDYGTELKKLISLAEARTLFKNDFEKALFPLYPVLEEIKNHLYENGALYASLSGSGSAVYGMFEDETTTNKALQTFKDLYWTAVASPLY